MVKEYNERFTKQKYMKRRERSNRFFQMLKDPEGLKKQTSMALIASFEEYP